MTRPQDLDPALVEQVRRWRHDLHRIPEPGLAEHRTAEYLTGVLTGLGVEVAGGVGGTGVVATLRRGTGDRAVMLRADMDALPIPERTDLPYRSTHDGYMHACGHDGHMAMVLGAGRALLDDRWGAGLDGTVHLLFQPAEEHGLGAKAMIADGLFDRFPTDAVFGLHNFPGHPAGAIATRTGGFMASEDNFEIRITGRGGHASQPQMVVDPIVAAAQVVLALQTIVARNVHPADPAVVSVTEVTTDGARNAIPTHVVLRGDTRSFSPAVQALLERRMRALCEAVCAAHGATCTVSYTHEFAPTVNHPGATALAVAAARATVGDDRVDPDCPPIMGSEDFGAYGEVVPACFANLGNGAAGGTGGTPLHSHDYAFNDDILATGVAFYLNVVRAALAPSGA